MKKAALILGILALAGISLTFAIKSDFSIWEQILAVLDREKATGEDHTNDLTELITSLNYTNLKLNPDLLRKFYKAAA